MATMNELIESYLEGPKLLRHAIAGMNKEQLHARPVPGKWSTLEVVCHLADFDPILADRIKRVIAEDKPSLVGADENRFAAALHYHERDVEEEIAIIDNTRRQLARILSKLPAEALNRIGVHNERGPRTLEELLAGAANHITHHLKFVADKRRALGLSA